jgi:uncharacterized protein involved in exopolysaccharide biosynthesis
MTPSQLLPVTDLFTARDIKAVILGALRRWWIAMAALSVVVAIPAVWFTLRIPPRFQATTTILMEAHRTDSRLGDVFPNAGAEAHLALLRSRHVAEETVRALPKTTLDELMSNPLAKDVSLPISNLIRRLRGEQPLEYSPEQRATQELRAGRISISSRPGNILEITAVATTPRAAMEIASTYVDTIIARTRAVYREEYRIARERIESELAAARAMLKEAEEELLKYRKTQGPIRISDRMRVWYGKLMQAEGQLTDVQAQRRIYESRLAQLRKQLAAAEAAERAARSREQEAARERAARERALADAEVAAREARERRKAVAAAAGIRAKGAEERVVRARARLEELQSRYTDEHPRVAAANREIEKAMSLFEKAAREFQTLRDSIPPEEREKGESTTGGGTSDESGRVLAEAVAGSEQALAALRAQEEELQGQMGNLRQALMGSQDEELEYARLERTAELYRQTVSSLSAKLDTLGLKTQSSLPMVSVVDPATIPLGSQDKQRLRLLAMAVAFSVAVGVGAPVGLEFLRNSLNTEQEVEACLGLAVLGAIPTFNLTRGRRELPSPTPPSGGATALPAA